MNNIQLAGGGDDYGEQKSIVINTPPEENIYTLLGKITDKLTTMEITLVLVLVVLVAGISIWSYFRWKSNRKS